MWLSAVSQKKNNERKRRIDVRKLHLPDIQEQYADEISNRFALYKKKMMKTAGKYSKYSAGSLTTSLSFKEAEEGMDQG